VVQAAEGGSILEFGLRRAQGPDAGIYGARASVIGGADAHQQRTGRADV
jgi:nicotinate phosphoribosyltransferase